MPATPDYMHYPIDGVPQTGERLPIADGIDWIRMPLPFLLGHINLWLLRDGDNTTIVDTGLNSKETQDIWLTLLGEKSVNRVVVTHMHPDHVGSAGWLCREFDAPLLMSRAEYLMCRVLVADTGREAPAAGVAFYRAAGFNQESLDNYVSRFGGFGKAVSAMPDAYQRLMDEQTLSIGEGQWQVITTSGHCPEHASLYDAKRKLLIAGDQLLPTISSNVSVWPTEPDADPLGAWLSSCHHLKDVLDDDVLVLPSHGKPFTGAQGRLDALIEEHETGLAKLVELCREPKRAVDVFSALFKSRISDGNLIMATGESVAHLNYLLHRGAISRHRDDAGVDWYETI
ncbi:MAG: MBL fold metallo-hydrolase [Pseudomonadota bacterium]